MQQGVSAVSLVDNLTASSAPLQAFVETMSGLEGAEVPAQPGMDFSEAGFLRELQVRKNNRRCISWQVVLLRLELCCVADAKLLNVELPNQGCCTCCWSSCST